MMENPRERARQRLRRWADEQQRAVPRLTQDEMGRRIGWRQNEVSRLISRGPLLEELDLVARMTGLPVSYWVADDESSAPLPVTDDAPARYATIQDVQRIVEDALRPFRATPVRKRTAAR